MTRMEAGRLGRNCPLPAGIGHVLSGHPRQRSPSHRPTGDPGTAAGLVGIPLVPRGGRGVPAGAAVSPGGRPSPTAGGLEATLPGRGLGRRRALRAMPCHGVATGHSAAERSRKRTRKVREGRTPRRACPHTPAPSLMESERTRPAIRVTDPREHENAALYLPVRRTLQPCLRLRGGLVSPYS